MSTSIDIEKILKTIEKAGQEWQQKFETTSNELIEDIRKLFCNCTEVLIELSISNDDNQQMKGNQLNADRIVSKLKELRDCLDDLWPSNMDSFGRDIFDVELYHVEAAEFFHPVPFYPDDDIIMKLYRWSVYDTNRTVIYRYYLERSELMDGQPYYVLGKSYPNGHSQIKSYGPTLPDYNQMKPYVINDLKGQGSPPIISSSVSSSEH